MTRQKVLRIQEETWRDFENYYSNQERLKWLELFHPSNARSKREHSRLVTYLYQGMVAIEKKYPFLQPPLSKEWDTKLIAEYIKRG